MMFTFRCFLLLLILAITHANKVDDIENTVHDPLGSYRYNTKSPAAPIQGKFNFFFSPHVA